MHLFISTHTQLDVVKNRWMTDGIPPRYPTIKSCFQYIYQTGKSINQRVFHMLTSRVEGLRGFYRGKKITIFF
jgi:hypothetical protein